MISDSTYRYLLQMVPVMLACFAITCLIVLCPSKWVAVVLTAPIWAIIFWWWHMQEYFWRDPEFRRAPKRERHEQTDIEKLREDQRRIY